MNRILLMTIVAFIVMIGAASAATTIIYDEAGIAFGENPILLKPDSSRNFTLKIVAINPTDLNNTYPVNITKELKSATGSVDDLVITAPATLYVDNDPMEVLFTVGLTGDAGPGDSYSFSIGYGPFDTEAELDSDSRSVETIPEFPTIALPVAAIIGLAFFMQRRKEE